MEIYQIQSISSFIGQINIFKTILDIRIYNYFFENQAKISFYDLFIVVQQEAVYLAKIYYLLAPYFGPPLNIRRTDSYP